MVTNTLNIDVMLSLVCCLDDSAISTSNATISAMINKSTMFFKMRCQYMLCHKLCHANFVGDTIIFDFICWTQVGSLCYVLLAGVDE
jgi:hypothetical protein